MKNILLIGVGGAGSKTVEVFYQKVREYGVQSDISLSAIVFDTDMADIKKIEAATPIPMADPASVGTICDRLGKKYLREWFPCDDKAVRSQEMIRGASQWRKKSYLAFLNLMNKTELRNRFIGALEKMVIDPTASCEVYVISSIAGGTGSGTFIPIALYAKRFLRKNLGKDPIVNAMILLPDIYRDKQTDDNRTKVVANAYAILRELNAINLVARNYNEGRFDRKRAQINLRIGSPDEPNVGVLFDSNDEQYWTPSAAPFSQIFMLDKITNVNAYAHNIVLANALYTLICTKTGGEFDSEASNHEVVRSQNNGASAIFAGIATSQITFPQKSVLSYLAHKKALDACNDEWLALYRAAEAKIKEREKQAKEIGNRYVMKNGEYAEIVLQAIEDFEDTNNIKITDIINQGTIVIDEDGHVTGNTVEEYYEKLKAYIKSRKPEQAAQAIKELLAQDVEDHPEKSQLMEKAQEMYEAIFNYFKACVEKIRGETSSISSSILSLELNENINRNSDLSIENTILTYANGTERKYVHPLAALAQLCRLKQLIANDADLKAGKAWDACKQRDIRSIPEDLTQVSMEVKSKSYYYNYGENRFVDFGLENADSEDYMKAKTSVVSDFKMLAEDAQYIYGNITSGAEKQLKCSVLSRVSNDLDILIAKYREFFKRFEKEKESLFEMTQNALHKDSGLVNGVVNVLSSKESKMSIAKEVFGNAGPESEEEIIETYDIVGASVYKTAHAAAVASKTVDDDLAETTKYNDKDSSAYRSLFKEMINSYSKFISRSDAFKVIGESNAVHAIELESGNENDKETIAKKMRDYFDKVTSLATPSIRWREDGDLNDLIRPSKIIVYMMSRGTAQYIKKRADFYGINIPSDMTSEQEMIEACAKSFVEEFSNDKKARVVVVNNMPDNLIYCTGEIMDITPLRVDKFDELSTDENAYYKAYKIAIDNAAKYDTDMWNPHLGFGWNKRGYLPYINEKKEQDCDVKMVKALLYALASGGLMLSKRENVYVFRTKDGSTVMADGQNAINMKNIAQLVNWARNNDNFVEDYSNDFDTALNLFKSKLPNIASDKEVATLKAAITGSELMRWMCLSLFEDPSSDVFKGTSDDGKEKKGPSILEFAYMIKISEESIRDNDDAERIATVAYSVFKDICSARANPETNPECYIDVYKHELNRIFQSVAQSKLVQGGSGDNQEAYFNQFASWLNDAGLFLDINGEDPFEADGIRIKYCKYDLNKNSIDFGKGIKAVKNGKAKGGAKAAAADEAAAEADEATAQGADIDE